MPTQTYSKTIKYSYEEWNSAKDYLRRGKCLVNLEGNINCPELLVYHLKTTTVVMKYTANDVRLEVSGNHEEARKIFNSLEGILTKKDTQT